MFESLRKRQRSISAVLFIGFAAMLMVSFGLDSYNFRSAKKQAALKVGEHEVDTADFYQQYQRRAEGYRRQFGASFEQLKGLINIQQQTIDGIVTDTVFDKITAALGLHAGLESIEQEIRKHPYFQEGFDQARWMDFLRATGMSEAQLEQEMGKQVIRQQIANTLRDSAIPTDEELRAQYLRSKRQASFTIAEFEAGSFEKSVTATEEQLEGYLQQNSEEYQTPRAVKLRYVKLSPENYRSKVEVTEEDIALHFEQQRSRFFEPKRVLLSTVQFTIPEEPAAEKKDELSKLLPQEKKSEESAASTLTGPEAARAAVRSALERLNNGEDVDPILSELKANVALKAKVEDTKWVDVVSGESSDQQSFVKRVSYEKRAEEKRNGTSGTLFIAREIKERREKELSEVRDQVISEIREENAGVYLEAAARELDGQFRSAPESLSDFAAKKQLVALETNDFVSSASKGDLAPALVATAAELQQGDRRLVTDDGAFYLIEVTAVREARVPALKEIREKVLADYRAEKSVTLARERATELLAVIEAKPEVLVEEAKKLGAKVETTKLLERTETGIPLLGLEENRSKLFALTPESKTAKEVFDLGKSFFVAQLAQEKAGDLAGYESDRSKLLKDEAEQSGERLLQALVESQKAVTQIWISPELAADRSLGGNS